MNSFSWFRRFHTELSSSRVKEHCELTTVDCSKQHKFRPIKLVRIPSDPIISKISKGFTSRNPLSQPLGRTLFRHRIRSIPAHRFVHTVSAPKTINVQNVVDYNRLGYIYLNPSNNEEIRSKMKYLTSKTISQPNTEQRKEATSTLTRQHVNKEFKNLRRQTSEKRMMSSFDTSQAFKQTARALNRSFKSKTQDTLKPQNVERKHCPKPNRCSPYIVSNEDAPSSFTLRQHYTGVMKKPNPINRIKYPSIPEVNCPPHKLKNTLYTSRQYYSTKKTLYIKENHIRSLKEYFKRWYPIKELRKFSDSREGISSNSKSIKKRVEVIRMEVVRLGKSLRQNKKPLKTSNLSKIFNKAHEQKKSDDGICESEKIFDAENKIEMYKSKLEPQTNSRPAMCTPENNKYIPNYLYVYAKPKYKKTLELTINTVKCAPTQPRKSKRDALSLTDLSTYNVPIRKFGYEDVPMIGNHKRNALIKAKSHSDLSIAKQRHSQQLLNAFHDVNRYK